MQGNEFEAVCQKSERASMTLEGEGEGMARVCVIVVNYNTRDYLRQCLASIERHHQIVVVDNDSSDGSAEMVKAEFPWVNLGQGRVNLGFGIANNVGMERAKARYTLLLNSDAQAKPGAIDRLADILDTRPESIACGGRLWNPDGTWQPSTANALTLWAVFCEQTYLEKLLPRSPLFSPYWHKTPFAEITPVAQVTGACLMMRPALLFDARYFLYCEDTDLCFRLAGEGSILYVPEADFIHALGSSTRQNPWFAIIGYNRGKELYFFLRHGTASGLICFALNRMGALLRLLAWGVPALLTLLLAPRLRRQAQIFARVLFAPVRLPQEEQRLRSGQAEREVVWTRGERAL